MHRLPAAVTYYFNKWFHQRNIIIVSDHKVKHIPIGGKTQFAVVMALVTGFCWASYSTGSYMAARASLKEKNQTLRSVANARIETNFSPMFAVTPTAELASSGAPAPNVAAALNDPSYTLASLNNTKLFARIAFLESKITELKNSNAAIIQRVSNKTSGHIDALENIIKQTGLNPDDLQEMQEKQEAQAARQQSRGKAGNASGGPYIPAEPIGISAGEYQLYNDLDRLTILRQIVGNLPLSRPIANAEEESRFGTRIDPFNGRLAFHAGLDLAGPAGSKIHSTADGTVSFAGQSAGYGNMVDIDHGFDISTRYGHLSAILVKDGQQVHKGDVIGIQGSTGRSTGAHLHYEVRYHGQPMNPEKFLTAGEYVSQE